MRDFTSSSGCEQMATEPVLQHIDGKVLDLTLINILDFVGVRVSSPVRTSDCSAIFYECCNRATYFSLGV